MFAHNWLKGKKSARITVHLHSGETIEGFLHDFSHDAIVLHKAVLMGNPEAHIPDTEMAGETWLQRIDVLMIQGDL